MRMLQEHISLDAAIFPDVTSGILFVPNGIGALTKLALAM